MYVQHVNLDLIDDLEGERTTAADLNIVTVLKQHNLEIIKTMFVPDILNISEYTNLFHTFRRIYGYMMVLMVILSMFNIVTGVTNVRF